MKKLKMGFVILLLTTSICSASLAQTQVSSQPEIKIIKKKNKAEGSTTVKVLIDETGKVVSAQAVSGHASLREAAEKAALKAKFQPTYIGGLAVKVSGNIIYNFVDDITWLQIGAEVADAEKSSEIPISFRGTSIVAKLPKDWDTERGLAQKLVEIHTEKINTEVKQNKNAEKKKSNKDDFSRQAKEDARTKHKILIEHLKKSLQNRLSDSELELWYLNLGLALGYEYNAADENLRSYILNLSKFGQNAPNDAAPIVLNNIKKLLNFAEKENFSIEDKSTIDNLLAEILNIEIDADGEVVPETAGKSKI